MNKVEEKHLELLNELAKRHKWYSMTMDGSVSLKSSSGEHEELASVKWVPGRGYNVMCIGCSAGDFDSVDAVIAEVYGDAPLPPPPAAGAGAAAAAGAGADKDVKAPVVASHAQDKTSATSTTEPKITDPEYAKVLKDEIHELSPPLTDQNMPHAEKEARDTIIKIMNNNTDFKGAFWDLANVLCRQMRQSAFDAGVFDLACERAGALGRQNDELRKQLKDAKVADVVALQKRVKELEECFNWGPLLDLVSRRAAAALAARGRRGGGIVGSFD